MTKRFIVALNPETDGGIRMDRIVHIATEAGISFRNVFVQPECYTKIDHQGECVAKVECYEIYEITS